MYGSHIGPFLTRSAYKTTFGRAPGLPGEPLGAHVDPMARHGVARDLTFEAFLATSVQHPVFHHFWIAKRYQK